MKIRKLVHWILTGVVCAMMLMVAGMYFMKHEEIVMNFTNLGYPTYLIYPLAIAKIAGVVMLLTKFNRPLTEMAYAGFFFLSALAAMAHLSTKDGEHMMAVGVLVLLVGSYATWKMTLRK
ncbi:MAG: hypothetical protein ACI837_001083 [Crocinitomicaceae bacterium]|jgi:hypothetical protein